MFGLITYYKRKKLAIDIEIQEYREKSRKEVQESILECAKEISQLDHDFYKKQEELNVEIAKLEARKETLKNDVETYKLLIAEKDKEIQRMKEITIKALEKREIIFEK